MPLTFVQFIVATCAIFLLVGIVVALDESRIKTQQSLFLQKQSALRNGIFRDDGILRNGPNFIFFHEQIKLDVAYEYQKSGLPLATVRAFTECPIHDSLEVFSKSMLYLFTDASALMPLRGIGDPLFDKKFFTQTGNISFAQSILTKDMQLCLRAISSENLLVRIKKVDQKCHKNSLPFIYFRESMVEVLSYPPPEHEFEYDSYINIAIMFCQRLKELMHEEMDDQANSLHLKSAATQSQSAPTLLETRKHT